MSTTLISALQAVAVGALVFLGQYAVAKLSKSAQSESTEVDSQERATKAWESYAQEMKGRLDELEDRLRKSEQRQDEDRRRISTLERQRDADVALIQRLANRLRRALSEIIHLGGQASVSDAELVDLAEVRLSADTPEKEDE